MTSTFQSFNASPIGESFTESDVGEARNRVEAAVALLPWTGFLSITRSRHIHGGYSFPPGEGSDEARDEARAWWDADLTEYRTLLAQVDSRQYPGQPNARVIKPWVFQVSFENSPVTVESLVAPARTFPSQFKYSKFTVLSLATGTPEWEAQALLYIDVHMERVHLSTPHLDPLSSFSKLSGYFINTPAEPFFFGLLPIIWRDILDEHLKAFHALTPLLAFKMQDDNRWIRHFTTAMRGWLDWLPG